MSIPAGCARFTTWGTSPGGEIWDFSTWAAELVCNNQADANQQMLSYMVAWTPAFAVPLKSFLTTDQTIEGIKGYFYPSGGPNADFLAEAASFSSIAGSGSTSNPLSVAMCVTLKTAHPGRRNRGRVYLPAAGLTTAGHKFTNGNVDSGSNMLRMLLNAFNASGPPGFAAVVSTTGSVANRITSVVTNNTPDTQRRRQKSFKPSYNNTQAVV